MITLPNASETPHSDASASPGKSALDDTVEEHLLRDLRETKKGDLGEAQRISDVRRSVERDLNVTTPGGKFELLLKLPKETLEDAPVARSMLNAIRENQSRISRGREDP